eukprot:INCI17419.1.p1 GENE.INCI17419.1~~INCI17419.1.p1  ORF type:complete len:224 (+),score=36.96 INCI17419.1:112-783(+)
MPKSKRAKVVHLTQTDPKGKESKSKMVEAVRAAIDELSYAYVFAYENMRTTFFQSVRKEWPDSKFFLSKNKVMQVALGRDEETEYGTGLHKVAQCIKGNVGLLVTNHPLDEVRACFAEHVELDFARSGHVSTMSIAMDEGPIEGQPFSNYEVLKQLGMPVLLRDGVIELLGRFQICTEGEVLSPEQCKLLKLFGHKMANFRLSIVGVWTKKTGDFKDLLPKEK